MKDIKNILYNEILPNVLKPVRYVGGEYNTAQPKEDDIRFAFAFPDVYEVGMSHLGMKIIYSLLNELEGVSCERSFTPMPDMIELLKQHEVPLYALESLTPLGEFDFVGFSIQYEMCLTNMLLMLELSDIPLESKDRLETSCPIIIGGGPCMVNPEPFCDFFDIIVIGEAEDLLPILMDIYKTSETKMEFLKRAMKYDGIYVPSFYEVSYNDNGTVKERKALYDAPESVKRAYIKNMDEAFFPESVIVPYTEPVHDRIMIEVMRGCPRGCRFCQAGFIYRPVRQKKIETVKKQIDSQIKTTGYEQVSLASLSSTDYKGCEEAIQYVVDTYEDQKTYVSLPSLRIDSFSMDIVKQIQKGRKGSLTFAPEAGSQKMRDVINKNISEEQIMSALRTAFSEGFSKIKLYFMVGLPNETDDDIRGISRLVDKIVGLFFDIRPPSKLAINVSVACFVPKPFTPFEYVAQNSVEEFKRKQRILVETMNKKAKLNYHSSNLSVIEAAFARGDRRLNKVLLNAYKGGCYFDSWGDYYKNDVWEKAFEDEGLSFYDMAKRTFETDDHLAWDFIDIGIKKKFFVKEFNKSMKADLTPDCVNIEDLAERDKENCGCENEV